MEIIDRQSLMATFLAETEENLAALEEGLIALERRPEDAEALASVFRQAHTLKGNSATLGFDGLAAFAHVLEDLLDRLRSRTLAVTPGLISLLLESLDAVRDMVAA